MIKAGDWVRTKGHARIGLAKRVAKDGSWVDVDWKGWSKRMNPEYLEVVTTIQSGPFEVTDVSRAQELGRE